jgi:hypothetical protein
MSDTREKGARVGSRSDWSGGNGKCPRRDYSERWLERRVRNAYQRVIEEPVPKDLLDIVAQIPALGSKR